MSVFQGIIEGSIIAFKEDAHLRLTNFLTKQGLNESTINSFKRAWTTVYLGAHAFGSSNKIENDPVLFAQEVINELKLENSELQFFDRYCTDYSGLIKYLEKDDRAVQPLISKEEMIEKYENHNRLIYLAARTELSNLNKSGGVESVAESTLPMKSTMLHRHKLRGVKFKWRVNKATPNSAATAKDWRYVPFASLSGRSSFDVVYGVCDLSSEDPIQNASNLKESMAGNTTGVEGYLQSNHVVGCKISNNAHVLFNSTWETFQFLTEMLLLPACYANAFSQQPKIVSTVGSTKQEVEMYIGSHFQLLPYPISIIRDSLGALNLVFENPDTKGGSSLESDNLTKDKSEGASARSTVSSTANLVPLASCHSPAFCSYMRRYPDVLLLWIVQFAVFLKRLSHGNYSQGDFHLADISEYVPESRFLCSNRYINNFYVRENGSLVLSNLSYSYNDAGYAAQDPSLSNMNRNVGFVSELLRDVVSNVLSLSRVYRFPLMRATVRQPLATENTSLNDSMQSVRDAEGEDKWESVLITEGCSLLFSFDTLFLSVEAGANRTGCDIAVLPSTTPDESTGSSPAGGIVRCVLIQEELNKNNKGKSHIAIDAQGTEGCACRIVANSVGSAVVHIGVTSLSYSVLEQQKLILSDKYEPQQAASSNFWTKLKTVRVVILPRNIPTPSIELQELSLLLEKDFALNHVYKSQENNRAENFNFFMHSMAVKGFGDRVDKYDEVSLQKSWKQIFSNSSQLFKPVDLQ